MKAFLIALALISGACGIAIPAPAWPIIITKTSPYDDGGTVAYFAKDSMGRPFVFCLDRRLMTSTYEAFYLSAPHPNKKGAKLLKKGSGEEREFLIQLKRSLDAQLGLDKEKEILERDRKKEPQLNELEGAISILLRKIMER